MNHPYVIFPDREIANAGIISETFRSLGISRFLDACRFVHELPYGYNSDRDAPMILFKERKGTCTTKHATIANLAEELSLSINRGVGIYAMTEALVTGTERILADYKLPYVPMIHCYLEYEGRKVDLTEGNRNGKNRPIDEFLFTRQVEANISAKAEYLIYRNTLKGLLQSREELKGVDIQRLLRAREEGLKILRTNIERLQSNESHARREVPMRIFERPGEARVKRLLSEADLPTADLTPGHLDHFFGCGSGDALEGVIGLEPYGAVALLRSLAVASTRRGHGLGTQLVAHAERYARERGVRALYLLTTTAEPFFRRLGYECIARDAVPEAIKATREYAGICPASSAVMTKRLVD